jgi:adenylate cyclase
VNTYLGPSAGERVLSGQIKHGDGETIPAAILISDMRGSTEMAEKLDRETYIATLNEYFGCMGEAVLESGGEILDFIGDAVLAIFPIQRGGFTKRRACQRALTAAREADARIQKLNIGRATDGASPLGFGIGLHVGEVMFGNIGTRDRLTFSVIGSSVNEVSRLEGLTKDLEQSILVTGKFAESLPENWVDLGVHNLRGVGKAMQVLAPTT